MLKAAGIEAWPALVNAERKLDVDMPSPGQFNHVITYVPQSGQSLWLDTTPGVAPFDMLMASLRDKQALVIPNDKSAELKTTPANPPFPANQTFAIEGAIDKDGTLKGHVKQSVRGDYEVVFRMAFRNTAPAQWKDLMQRVSSSEGFGGDVSNVTASSPDDTSKPFEISYDYTRKNYGDGDDHRMVAPLPRMGLEGAAVQEKKPVDPVVLGALGEVLYTAKITQPDAVVDKMQNNVSLSEPYADYESSYLFSGNLWTTTRRLKIKQNEVSLASWENYKKFSKALSDDESTITVTFASEAEKDAAMQGADKAGPNDVSQDELQKKWEEAGQALQRNDLTTAEDILQELLKKYGDQRGLHAGLGEVYVQRNQKDSAVSEFEKEEQLYPDNLGVYRVVATYYLWLHRDDSAAEQYRKWIQLDLKNYDAYAGLSTVLYRQKKYPEVLQLWLEAAQQLPDKKQVKKALAYAYLANKQAERALPLFQQVLDADSKPLEYNSVSYQLADANIDLPKAKEWGDRALGELYHESLDNTTEDAALSNTANIGATWDTVGWVSYKMGDYAKAEEYLRSAFTLSQDPVEGDHLAQVYQKQGKKDQAQHTYRLAYAQAKQPLKDQIKERYQQLMGTDADPEDSPVHLKRGSASRDFGPADELSRARTSKISTSAPTSGSATLTIAFTPGKIENVKFVSGDEKLKPMASQIASSKLRADFPDTTPARLTRRGVLMCGSTGCDFTLLLPSAPYATESQP